MVLPKSEAYLIEYCIILDLRKKVCEACPFFKNICEICRKSLDFSCKSDKGTDIFTNEKAYNPHI